MTRPICPVLMACALLTIMPGTPSLAWAQTPDSLHLLEDMQSWIGPEIELSDEDIFYERSVETVPSSAAPWLHWNMDMDSDIRTRLAISVEPATWFSARLSILREADEDVRLDVRDQWILGEHTSGFVRVGTDRISVTLGDFKVRSAAGVSSLSVRRTGISRRYPDRTSMRLPTAKPYAGGAQQPAPRGVLAVFQPLNMLSLSVFKSRRLEDGDRSFRKSWTMNTDGARTQRRKLLLEGMGGLAALETGIFAVGLSWTSFHTVHDDIRRLEASMRLGPVRGTRAAAFLDIGLDGSVTLWAMESHIILRSTTISGLVSMEGENAVGPWGPTVRMSSQPSARKTAAVAVRTRPDVGMALVWGVQYKQTIPVSERTLATSRTDVWLRADATSYGAEIQGQFQPSGTKTRMAAWASGRLLPAVAYRVNVVATAATGLSARVVWSVSDRIAITVGRSMNWNHDPDPWAVLVMDRIPGSIGLARMSHPGTHQSIRADIRSDTFGRMVLAFYHGTIWNDASGQPRHATRVALSWQLTATGR